MLHAQHSPVPALDATTFANTYHRTADFFAGPLPASDFFGMARVEDVVHDFRLPVPLNRTTYYTLLFIRQGTLTRTDGLTSRVLAANTVYFDAPGQLFAVEAASPDCSGYFAVFDAEYYLRPLREARALLDLPFFQFDRSPAVALPPGEAAELLALLRQMERCYRQPDQHALLSAMLHLFCLRAKQFSLAAPTATSGAEALTQKFKNLLKQHILTKRSVREYADLLAVTPGHLSKTVKRVTGQPASDVIAAVLVLEARVLLRQTSLNISEIAFHLSIEDMLYFARLIKKHTGHTPSEYCRLSQT